VTFLYWGLEYLKNRIEILKIKQNLDLGQNGVFFGQMLKSIIFL
jgi:hypothetical protein